jgi:hypothetical protein
MLRLLKLLPLIFVPMFVGCPPYFTPPGPPMVSVNQWEDVEVIFVRLEGAAGPQSDIDEARLAIADLDGDGKFSSASLQFLILPRAWASPMVDPMALYVSDVQTDPDLSANGVLARVMSANRIRDSLTTIFTP